MTLDLSQNVRALGPGPDRSLIQHLDEEKYKKTQETISSLMHENFMWAQITESQKKAQYQLNQEFSKILKNFLVYKWYPTDPLSGIKIPNIGRVSYQGHTHLEINGYECLAYLGMAYKEKRDSTSYHHAIPFNISPQELLKLKKFIDETPDHLNGKKMRAMSWNTCAGSSADILRQYTGIQIPSFLVALSPTLSASYLYLQKKLGNERIGEIEYRGGQAIHPTIRFIKNVIPISVEIVLASLYLYLLSPMSIKKSIEELFKGELDQSILMHFVLILGTIALLIQRYCI